MFVVSPNAELSADNFCRPFVTQMIERDPAKRIALPKVIRFLNPLQSVDSIRQNRLSMMHYYGSGNMIFSGAFSRIYLVPLLSGTSVVVKKISLENSSTSSKFTMKLFNELKTLHHPNVVRLLEYDHDDRYK